MTTPPLDEFESHEMDFIVEKGKPKTMSLFTNILQILQRLIQILQS